MLQTGYGNNIFYFEMNRTIWLLPCRLLLRIHLACSCLNSLQKPYDLMAFLHTTGNAKKAKHHPAGLARLTKTCKSSAIVCAIFWSLSIVGNIIFYFEMNRIWLLPCHLLLRMHLARSCLNGLKKSYDPMVFLHTSADAKKAWHHLARMTETCNQLTWNMNRTFYRLTIYDIMIQAISWQLTHSAYDASYWLLNTHIALQDFPQFTDDIAQVNQFRAGYDLECKNHHLSIYW